MRLMVYGLYFTLCCFLLSIVEAQNRKIQKSKDIDDGSEERYTKYKKEENHKNYKYKINENNEKEGYKINKYDKQNCRGKNCERSKTKDYDEDSYLTNNNKYFKYTKKINKFTDESEEEPTYKKNKNAFKDNNRKIKAKEIKGHDLEFKKSKRGIIKEETEADSEEDDIVATNKQNDNMNEKKQLKISSRRNEDQVSQSKTKKSKDANKKIVSDTDEDSDEDVKEVPRIKLQKNDKKSNIPDNDESKEENPKIKRKHFVPPDDDSDEDTIDEDNGSETSEETDESDETEQKVTETCRKKSACPDKKFGNDEDSDESNESNKNLRRKKIKYSIKFAHEKQRNAHNENDNILKKIHRGKKYKHDDDDDDDSSEEHIHPKRIRYLDEDEE